MKPGDLVRVTEYFNCEFTVGNMNMNASGFKVPAGSIALVLEIEVNDDQHVHILVDGKLGWIYPEDGEVINESG
jgi:phosphotransferase system HPr-like phosphotransfer protein